jgi:type I restriction enzyme S subunit
MVCDTVYRFRCIEDRVTPLYLELALNSPDVLRAIDQRKAGISESGLSLTHSKIGTVEIPLCSLDEQQDIVRQLDEQTSVMDVLEADIDLNLQKAEALRQSILKKAFAGELVPQDPADEPAAALLARIRAEREAAAATPKSTKIRTKKA